LCQKLYSPAGTVGLTNHVKTEHTAEEFAEWSRSLREPPASRAPVVVKPRGRPKKKPVKKAAKPERKPLVEEDEPDEVEEHAPEPARGAMPQHTFLLSGAIPPSDFVNGDEPRQPVGSGEYEIADENAPNSDIKSGTATIKPVRTNNFMEANVFAFTPKVFQFSSQLLHTCWQITVQEWGWDPNMPFGNWLDLYLFMTMERLGIDLQPYRVKVPGGNGHNGGNGNGSHPEERSPTIHAANEQHEPPSFWFGQ
jgi:hypothetical protein